MLTYSNQHSLDIYQYSSFPSFFLMDFLSQRSTIELKFITTPVLVILLSWPRVTCSGSKIVVYGLKQVP